MLVKKFMIGDNNDRLKLRGLIRNGMTMSARFCKIIFGTISPANRMMGESIIMANNSPCCPMFVTMYAVKIEVLETTARLVPSDVVANNLSGVFSKSRTIWAE